MYLILPAALGPGIHSASNRNEYQKQKNNISASKARLVLKDDNLTAICEQTV
jgi:citrate lyase synthetase